MSLYLPEEEEEEEEEPSLTQNLSFRGLRERTSRVSSSHGSSLSRITAP